MNEHSDTNTAVLEAPAETKGWRQHLKVHPACDVAPLLPRDQLRELADDIAAHGMREPIVLYTPMAMPGLQLLIDGRNRLDALELLGRPIFREPPGTPARLHDDIRWLCSDGDAEEIPAEVVSRNIRRRHLSERDRVELALEIVRAKASAPTGAASPIGAPSPIGHSPSTEGGSLIRKPITGANGRLRGSTPSVVGQVAKLASMDRKTARKHLAAKGVVKAAAKSSRPAKTSSGMTPLAAQPAATSKNGSPAATAPSPKRTGLEAAVLALQCFSDKKDVQKELRSVLTRAQVLARRYPTRCGQLGDFYLQIGVAFADDSIALSTKNGDTR